MCHNPNKICDDELVLIAIAGNLAAFDQLVKRYRGAVLRVARQVLGPGTEAEDAAQDALLIAYKALPQLQDPAHFPGWLYAITRRRALRVATASHGARRIPLSETDQLILQHCPELTQDPAEAALRRLNNVRIREALQSLPADTRVVMELRWLEEWPVARISEFLMLPLSTVKWRLHAGRKSLKQSLSAYKSCHVADGTA
jgi:RNA polymerase sigma-70 factor, ECF subfamily